MRPVAGDGPQIVEQEVGEELGAARRVHDLGVELDAVDAARFVAGDRRTGAFSLTP